MSTALQRALAGGNLSGSEAQKLANTVKRGQNAIARAREMGGAYGKIVLHEAEASGAALAAGTLAGRYGDEKLKIWGWDGRGVVGLLGLFAGAYGRANKRNWGGHVYSVAQGAAHATVADAGRRWGERMAADSATTTPAAPPTTDGKTAPPASDVKPAGIGQADLDKYLREVTLANAGTSPDVVRARVV